MTSLNFSSELKNWLGELSSRMSLVGVSCGVSAGKMITSSPLFDSYLTLIRPLHVAATVLLFLCLGVGNVWGGTKTVTYTVTETNAVSTSGTVPTGSSASFSQTYGTAQQATAGNSFTLTLSNFNVNVTKFTFSMSSNSSQGQGNLSYKVDSGSETFLVGSSSSSSTGFNSWGDNTSYGNTYRNVNWTVNFTPTTSLVIYIRCVNKNSIYVESFTITYEEGTIEPHTVSFYTTSGTYSDLKEGSAGAGVTPPTMNTPCDGWAFQGWSTSQSTSTTSTTVLSTVTLSEGKYYPTANTTLYPVYTKSGGTVFSKYQLITSASGDLSGKYLLSTGSITATGAVTSSGILPIESLTPGTIQYAEKEFTIVKNGSNSNYFIKFPNGEYLGNSNNSTDLKRNNSTTAPTTDVNHFLWTFSTTAITNVNNSTRDLKYNSGLTTPAIKSYAQTGNSYPRVKLYKRIEDELTYYYSYPTCCTALGAINGSVFGT